MASVSITEHAAKKVEEFKAKEPKESPGLRIWVSGGGCSGFQYGMAFDNKHDDDEIIESNGIKVLIDPMSAKHLEGSQIDFVETLEGSGFKINNPNVKSACACGSSFEV